MKLYEFSALLQYRLVVAAENEEELNKKIAGLTLIWLKGDFCGVSDVELVDIREPKSPDLEDEAHILFN